jgi:hypothetical protein
VFADGVMQYYENVADVNPRGQIAMEDMTDVHAIREKDKVTPLPLALPPPSPGEERPRRPPSPTQLVCVCACQDQRPHTFEIKTSGRRSYIFSAKTLREMQKVPKEPVPWHPAELPSKHTPALKAFPPALKAFRTHPTL